MNRLERLLLVSVSLITLAACGTQATPTAVTPTQPVGLTLPPTWTPAPTWTVPPTRQVTKAPPTATATVTPTFRPLATLTALPPTATLADPTRSTISGLVLDPLGKPMANVKINLSLQAKPNQVLQTTTSGSDGRFQLTQVAPGNYHLQTAVVSFKSTKCFAAANINIPSGGLRETVNLVFAPTCT